MGSQVRTWLLSFTRACLVLQIPQHVSPHPRQTSVELCALLCRVGGQVGVRAGQSHCRGTSYVTELSSVSNKALIDEGRGSLTESHDGY